MKTAILMDGSFFIKRYRLIYRDWRDRKPSQVAKDLYAGVLKDLKLVNRNGNKELYRIFFYDCPPLAKRLQNPVSKKAVDFSKSPEAIFRTDLHNELRRKRKVALRLG